VSASGADLEEPAVRINIAARHGQLSDATRGQINAKGERLSRLFERLTAVEFTVNLEHPETPTVELRVNAEHKHDFVATETAEGLMAAVDGAIHKLEQQLRKYKERVYERHRQPGSKASGPSPEA
jgi:putative sigma-54 modulation protein